MFSNTSNLPNFAIQNFSLNTTNKILIHSRILQILHYGHLLLIVLGSCGLLACLLSSIFVALYRNHVLIKATGRCNIIIVLFGLFLGNFATLFSSVSSTSKICTFILFCHGLCFGTVFSSFLVKTILITRVYFGSLRGQTRFSWVGTKAILAQVASLIFLEVDSFLTLIVLKYFLLKVAFNCFLVLVIR